MSEAQRAHLSEVFPIDRIHPGQHLRLRAGDILVDESYQRELSSWRVTRMAADWINTGPIRVSQRTDTETAGSYYVYDGQHRLRAFLAAWGEEAEIDAWVEPLTRNEEARRFAHQYNNVVRVPPHAVLNALASTGDKHAVGVVTLMQRFGLKPTININAITTLSQLYRHDPDLLETTLEVMKEAWNDWGYGFEKPTGPVYAGLFSLYRYHGGEIARSRLVEVLSGIPPRRLIYRSMQLAPGRTKLDEEHVYQTLIDLYNGRRGEGSRGFTRLEAKPISRSVHKRQATDPI